MFPYTDSTHYVNTSTSAGVIHDSHCGRVVWHHWQAVAHPCLSVWRRYGRFGGYPTAWQLSNDDLFLCFLFCVLSCWGKGCLVCCMIFVFIPHIHTDLLIGEYVQLDPLLGTEFAKAKQAVILYGPAVFGHSSPAPIKTDRAVRIRTDLCTSRFTIKVYAWLTDSIHRRKNCPTGMISGWVQKVTQHRETILYKKQLFLTKKQHKKCMVTYAAHFQWY